MDTLTTSERQRLDDEGYLTLEGVVEPRRVGAMLLLANPPPDLSPEALARHGADVRALLTGERR